MIVGSPKEIFKGEARVAMTPEIAKQILTQPFRGDV